MSLDASHPVYVMEKCPIPWTSSSNINDDYPYRNVDAESQAAIDYVSRRYLETLWLPEDLAPLPIFLSDLKRLIESETPPDPASLTRHILLSRKRVKKKYTTFLPHLLESGSKDGDEELQMINWARAREKRTEIELSSWLSRFHIREYEIQILLRLHMLTLPGSPEPELTSPSRKHKKGRARPESTEEGLLHLMEGMKDLLEFDSAIPRDGTSEEKPRMELYYDEVVARLFRLELPEICDACQLKLCPSKYDSPPTSSPSSPALSTRSTSLMPIDAGPQRLRSRSPSIIIDDEPPRLSTRDSMPSRSGSVKRELSRSRSASVFSFNGDEVLPNSTFSRGGISTTKALFSHQVDMRKSNKEKVKDKSTTFPERKDLATTSFSSNKRPFARSVTAPLKPIEDKPKMVFIAETPARSRVRSPSMDLDDSPDPLQLGPGDDYSEERPAKRRILVPETPIKGV